jgi:hypothetical protein
MKNQNGYTLFEIVFALIGIVGLAMSGLIIWVICHFVAKYW